MTDTALNLPQAARHLGVTPRALRQAIRAGRLPATARLGATAPLSPEWIATARTAIEATPAIMRHSAPKVAPFARYKGTSAWRKYRVRVRAYESHRAGTRPD